MPPLSPRTLLCLGLLGGIVTGCARSRTASPAPSRSSTVTSEEIDRSPGEPIEKVLMQRVPGLLVMRTPDGGIALRIRGASSIFGDNEPLYVIDGIPVQAGPSGSLTGINPYDIASVEVLKTAASTTMYGVRGANGVIVVTTKRGRQ